jgi:hypothetical protein
VVVLAMIDVILVLTTSRLVVLTVVVFVVSGIVVMIVLVVTSTTFGICLEKGIHITGLRTWMREELRRRRRRIGHVQQETVLSTLHGSHANFSMHMFVQSLAHGKVVGGKLLHTSETTRHGQEGLRHEAVVLVRVCVSVGVVGVVPPQ